MLDPFIGSGTVGVVAEQLGRDWLGIELNPAFAAMAEARITASRQIYVASLSDYNNGRLHGRWIDANQDFQAIWDEIGEMLAGSQDDPADEHAIHDASGFGAYRVGEYDSIEDGEIQRSLRDRVHGSSGSEG